MSTSVASPSSDTLTIEQRVAALLEQMTLNEKIGRMSQLNSANRIGDTSFPKKTSSDVSPT